MTSQLIILTVADYYHITLDEITSPTKKGLQVKARFIAMYFLREEMRLPLEQIGTYFKGRNNTKDHSTVLFAIRSIINEASVNYRISVELEEIRDLLKRYKFELEEIESDEVFQQNDFFLK